MMHLLLCRHVLSIGLGFASSVMPVVGRGVRVVVGPAGCSAQLGERRGRVAVVEKLRDPTPRLAPVMAVSPFQKLP